MRGNILRVRACAYVVNARPQLHAVRCYACRWLFVVVVVVVVVFFSVCSGTKSLFIVLCLLPVCAFLSLSLASFECKEECVYVIGY